MHAKPLHVPVARVGRPSGKAWAVHMAKAVGVLITLAMWLGAAAIHDAWAIVGRRFERTGLPRIRTDEKVARRARRRRGPALE